MKRSIQILLVFAFIVGLSPVAPGSASPGDQPEIPSLLAAPAFPYLMFLPLVNSGAGTTLTGRVVDASGKPVASAKVVEGLGISDVTDSQGYYELSGLGLGQHSLAVFKDGYVFSPSVQNVTINSAPATGPTFTALVAASELIQNGSFESDLYWEFPKTVYPAAFTTAQSYTGVRSARVGITNVLDNAFAYSSTRQLFAIPAGSPKVTLRLWMYTGSTESAASPAAAQPAAEEMNEAQVVNDAQYVLVLDKYNTVVQTLLWARSSTLQWRLYEFDLTSWAGKEVKIEVGAVNDGANGITYAYVDEMSVLADTPTAAACGNRLSNSGFEYEGAWGIPLTAYPADYSTIRAHTGTRSMRTGITSTSSNVLSWSDGYQEVYIPANATEAMLKFWYYPTSGEAALGAAVEPAELPTSEELGQAALAKDAQYVVVLNSSGYILEYSMWVTSNTQTWTYKTLDLLKYAGKTIRIQFGTYNNGVDGITSMFVDDMELNVCTTATTPTPTPTPTPSPTPITGCTEKIVNNGFETTSTWYIPLTVFSAGYSTDRAHLGTRSMRTGITYQAYNRFSYSDFRQTVTVPSNATQAVLALYSFTATTEATSALLPEQPVGDLEAATAVNKDVQYILILDAYGNWIDTLLWERTNDQAWKLRTYDLHRYAGRTIMIQFGTYNDGLNGISSMHIDDVSLQVCP